MPHGCVTVLEACLQTFFQGWYGGCLWRRSALWLECVEVLFMPAGWLFVDS